MTLTHQEAMPAVRGVTLRAISATRWRVLDRRGLVLGHLRAEPHNGGIRFFAERFDHAATRLRVLGSFWSAGEAVECLRYLR